MGGNGVGEGGEGGGRGAKEKYSLRAFVRFTSLRIVCTWVWIRVERHCPVKRTQAKG